MRLAIFASGGGSNFQAILDATRRGTLCADVVLCVTNSDRAGVIERATKHSIPVLRISPNDYLDADDYSADLLSGLDASGVDFIALAGYMKMIPAEIVERFRGRIVNIHPALLPAFGGKGMYGMRVHEAVIASGEETSGASVHVVDEEYDTGPIVLQYSVPVLPDDTPGSLAARVLEVEHRLYPDALALFAEERIVLEGSVVRIKRPNL